MKTTHAYASRMKALTLFSLTVLLVAGCREKPMEKAPETPQADVQASISPSRRYRPVAGKAGHAPEGR